MSAIADIRNGIVTDLTAGIQGWEFHPYMRATVLSGHGYLDVSGPEEFTLGGIPGNWLYTVRVRAFLAITAEEAAQEAFDLLRDPSYSASIKAVLEPSDSAASSLVDVGATYLNVGPGGPTTEYSPPGVDGVSFLFVEWPVEVAI